MTRRVRRRKRRRRRQPKKEQFKMQPEKKTSNNEETRKNRARSALVARLPGGAFREFLVQNVPGYTSLEDTLIDEYVKTVGKWEGWLFFYLGVIYILKNFTQTQNPLVMAPSSLVAASL
ncbi:hypothetical protein KC19_3G178400 [Ceratodon purpureus]|uniref:Uncharacterized protein n=1 Tax=Ceratodon purpureus TaxID=3225 RepID=A0A8T0ILU3_CERPU|nr:hypothetical protein KC19_3G178400 [Ceratodon purpureus]